MMPLLLIILVLPLIGAAAVLARKEESANLISASTALVELALVVVAFAYFASGSSLSISLSYIKSLGISFGLNLTSITFVLVLLTAIVFFAAALANFYFVKEERKGYNALLLLAETGMVGVFLSTNLFVLYLFWDLSIVVSFFLIFHFGGYDRRYAGIKFIIYSILSSSLFLIGIILLYAYLPGHSFNIAAIEAGAAAIPSSIQLLVFALFVVAFMIKIPVFPFHSWMPDAYSEAPASGSMVIAGVLSKFGAYGLLLTFVLVPIAHTYGIYVAEVVAFSTAYAALVAVAQKEMKRMVSYLSMVEMGFIAFAITAFSNVAFAGALYGMLGHALTISLLFLIVFAIERAFGTSVIGRLKGVINSSRLAVYLILFGILAAIGLPLTTGFISDLLIFFGAVGSYGLFGLLPLFAVIINGAYLFWLIERSFTTTSNEPRIINSLNRAFYAAFILLASAIVLFGIIPSLILNYVGGV